MQDAKSCNCFLKNIEFLQHAISFKFNLVVSLKMLLRIHNKYFSFNSRLNTASITIISHKFEALQFFKHSCQLFRISDWIWSNTGNVKEKNSIPGNEKKCQLLLVIPRAGDLGKFRGKYTDFLVRYDEFPQKCLSDLRPRFRETRNVTWNLEMKVKWTL